MLRRHSRVSKVAPKINQFARVIFVIKQLGRETLKVYIFPALRSHHPGASLVGFYAQIDSGLTKAIVELANDSIVLPIPRPVAHGEKEHETANYHS